MAAPTIRFNNSTGSDTQASGSESPATAVFGTGASLNGTTTVDLSADTPDLSGVATDGTAVLWVDSSSGRKWARITAVDDGADTVTVASAYSPTESGRTWAIGGKRSALDSALNLFDEDWEGDWHIDIEHTGSSYILTSTIVLDGSTGASAGQRQIFSSSGTRPIITSATSGLDLFSVNDTSVVGPQFKNLHFTHTGAARGDGVRVGEGGSIIDCVFDGLLQAINGADEFAVINCEIKNCTSTAGAIDAPADDIVVVGCFIHDNAGDGIRHTGTGPCIVVDCIIANNAGDGIEEDSTSTVVVGLIMNCTIYGNGGDGVDWTTGVSTKSTFTLMNNIIDSNTGFGVNITNAVLTILAGNKVNAYRNNTAGARNNLPAGDGDITLTGDPFTNAAGDDFTLNDTAGAGAACQAVASPTSFTGATGTNFKDVGAFQVEDGGGGGGETSHVF